MNIPEKLKALRKELKRRGDGEIIAKRASKGSLQFSSDDVTMAFFRGRGHEKLVMTAYDFYMKKYGQQLTLNKSLSKVTESA